MGLPYRILNMNPKKELLWGLWVEPSTFTGPNTLERRTQRVPSTNTTESQVCIVAITVLVWASLPDMGVSENRGPFI